jgi:hypothetical protein
MLRPLTACLALALAASTGAAELYKWVDDNGVVNYSNSPPAKTKNGKAATVIEDRTSVYTPEKSVTEALARPRPPVAPQPTPPIASIPPGNGVGIPPGATYDPCSNPNDPNCQGYYGGYSPGYAGGRHRPPHASTQPVLPPGTIAGQATASGGTIPGLSGLTPRQPLLDQPQQSAPFRTR